MSEDKKTKLSGLASAFGNATKTTVSTIGQATKKVTTSVAENAKEGSEQLGKQLDQMRFDNDKKRLCPLFKEDLNSSDFLFPSIIRVVGYDKRRDNKACDGAVGFMTGKDVKLLNIYKEYVDLLNVSFYPYLDETVYYVDPCYNTLFIKIDEYFAYLKKVRVDELTRVAQDLGARHVEITLKSNQTSAQTQGSSASAGLFKIDASSSVSKSRNECATIEVAAKIDFKGNNSPIRPTLIYFQNESDINALIEMRLNPDNGNDILSKTYSLQYGNSSGIKVSDAQKIDTLLSNVNCHLSRSIASEALYENSTILEYSITF